MASAILPAATRADVADGVRPLPLAGLLVLAAVPTGLNALACRVAIPALQATGALRIEVSYFLAVGLLVLAPMFFVALHMAGSESRSRRTRDVLARMRVRPLDGEDWIWIVLTTFALAATSFLMARVFLPAWGRDPVPFFFRNLPLGPGEGWIILAWIPFFVVNVLGEELFWRGYVQPRQERVHGDWTWLVQGVLWAGWHLPMGVDMVLAALPALLVLPAVAQVRRSTTVAIVVHALFGAFGFLALAMGFAG